MPRLIDTIRKDRAFQMPVWVAPEFENAWARQCQNLMPLIENPDLPILLIDNVSDYYYFGSDQEHWDLVKDFPNLAPPWPAFWAEHRLATKIHSKERGDTDLTHLMGQAKGKIGALVHALDPARITGEGELPPGTRWILWCELFIEYGVHKDDRPTGPHGSVFFCVDADGHCVGKPWMQGFSSNEDVAVMKGLMTFFHPTLLAVSFLHCKNVVIEDQAVPKPLAKKYHAKTGHWPTRYKTLIIEPLKQILKHEGHSDRVGAAKAMHICRGHFRDYREGRGLFGKYKQLVWTPSVIRGTKGKHAAPREVEVRI
jgi:hypothetical protein